MIICHKFFAYKQSEGQSFVAELRKLSNECSFGDLKDSLIKDMIICGVVDNSLRERMLHQRDINLKKAIELGQAAEETKMHAKQLTEKFDSSVDKVTKVRKKL